jgi:hypothetical protein
MTKINGKNVKKKHYHPNSDNSTILIDVQNGEAKV